MTALMETGIKAITVMFLFLLMLIIPCIIIDSFSEENESSKMTEPIIGIVTNYEKEEDTSGFLMVTTKIKRLVVFTYNVNGIEYKGSGEVSIPYEKNDEIEILYNPKEPIKYKIANNE